MLSKYENERNALESIPNRTILYHSIFIHTSKVQIPIKEKYFKHTMKYAISRYTPQKYAVRYFLSDSDYTAEVF